MIYLVILWFILLFVGIVVAYWKMLKSAVEE
jgi:cbb3-type cytochrome oxidase subunit 3